MSKSVQHKILPLFEHVHSAKIQALSVNSAILQGVPSQLLSYSTFQLPSEVVASSAKLSSVFPVVLHKFSLLLP